MENEREHNDDQWARVIERDDHARAQRNWRIYSALASLTGFMAGMIVSNLSHRYKTRPRFESQHFSSNNNRTRPRGQGEDSDDHRISQLQGRGWFGPEPVNEGPKVAASPDDQDIDP